MKTLEKEIHESIAKNLPSQVGEVLKARLEQAEFDAKELEKSKKEIEYNNQTITELNAQVIKNGDLNKREAELNAKAKELEERENKAEIESLKVKLEASKTIADNNKEMAMGLVRNIQYRKNIFDYENQAPYQDPNGVWHHPSPKSKSFIQEEGAE